MAQLVDHSMFSHVCVLWYRAFTCVCMLEQAGADEVGVQCAPVALNAYTIHAAGEPPLPTCPLPCEFLSQYTMSLISSGCMFFTHTGLLRPLPAGGVATVIETQLKPPKKARALSRPQQQTPAPIAFRGSGRWWQCCATCRSTHWLH